MYNFNEKVGYRIFKARSEKGITLKELGDLIGIAESTAQRYEKGKIKSLDIEMIKRIAKALNVTPSYLMGWEDKEEIETIAAHHDGEEWTEEELQAIEDFKQFVLSKRNKKD